MKKPSKKIAIALAGLAAAALVIGLSVGLTRRNNDNERTANASAANSVSDADFDKKDETCYSKSGKSGGGKSGGSSGSSDSGDTTRRLVVPGVEDYAGGASRRKLRNELVRELQFGSSCKLSDGSAASALKACSGAELACKLADGVCSEGPAPWDGICRDPVVSKPCDEEPIKPVCGCDGKTYQKFCLAPFAVSIKDPNAACPDESSSSSKSGKSGGSSAKCGKSNGGDCSSRDYCTTSTDICTTSTSKSGKSGGGGKSGGSSGSKCGKSNGGDCTSSSSEVSYCTSSTSKSGKSGGGKSGCGKSNGGSCTPSPTPDDNCVEKPPTICEPTPDPTPEPTPEPTPCNCEGLPFYLLEGVCASGCDVCVKAGTMGGIKEGCDNPFESRPKVSCCEEKRVQDCLGGGGNGAQSVKDCKQIVIDEIKLCKAKCQNNQCKRDCPLKGCTFEGECSDRIPALDFAPSPFPTSGSTPTVSDEASSEATLPDRAEVGFGG